VPSISIPHPVNKFDLLKCKDLKRPFIILTLKIFRFKKKFEVHSSLFLLKSSALQELLRLLWNPKKVHYIVLKGQQQLPAQK